MTKLMLVCFVFAVLFQLNSGTPADCVGAFYATTVFENVHQESISETGLLEFFNLNDWCKDRSVCFVNCGDYVPGCKKKAFFTDFLNFPGVSKSNRIKAYENVCIQRSYASKSEQRFWLKEYLAELLKDKCDLNVDKNDKLEKIASTVNGKKSRKGMYFVKQTEILMSVKKLCKDKFRADYIERKLKTSFRQGSTAGEKMFVFRNDLSDLKDLFTEKIRDLRRIFDDFDRDDKDDMEKWSDRFVEKFVRDDLASGQTYVCNCAHFGEDKRTKSSFQQKLPTIKNQCKKVCNGGNVLEEEIIFE